MVVPEAFFLGTGAARRLAVCWRPPPSVQLRGTVLFVPPFAEEMNKSRRMVALTAAQLAAQGYLTLRLDLRGCGDSAGRLADAHWDDWLDDLQAAAAWLSQQRADGLWLWSLRAGALLAAAVQPRLPAACALLLWQPVLAGRQHLIQFLRLRVAADAFAVPDAAARATTQSLMKTLASGQAVDVAGYVLPPGIAIPLAAAEFRPLVAAEIVWLEVDGSPSPALLPASAARLAQWQAAGQRVTARAVTGPSFWTTQEMEDCPALVSATVEAMCRPA